MEAATPPGPMAGEHKNELGFEHGARKGLIKDARAVMKILLKAEKEGKDNDRRSEKRGSDPTKG